ncbi:hypothetical protein, partial [Salinivibrio sp. PR6]|uniref:hypothetical protein n=1 Tax=Salinivibrio sp. PR6 TaxID=1909485 RepID=UPI001A7E1319
GKVFFYIKKVFLSSKTAKKTPKIEGKCNFFMKNNYGLNSVFVIGIPPRQSLVSRLRAFCITAQRSLLHIEPYSPL